MWGRKREIVTQNPGLTYHPASETLKDMAGCAAWINSAQLLMNGPYKPTIIVRMDEIQRQFAGNETDSSGTKGNLMGEFLNWVNDRKVICSLNLGVSGRVSHGVRIVSAASMVSPYLNTICLRWSMST